MAQGGYGLSFQPGQNGGPQGPLGLHPAPVQTAIRLISTRLPDVLSPRAVVPREIADTPGSPDPGLLPGQPPPPPTFGFSDPNGQGRSDLDALRRRLWAEAQAQGNGPRGLDPGWLQQTLNG